MKYTFTPLRRIALKKAQQRSAKLRSQGKGLGRINNAFEGFSERRAATKYFKNKPPSNRRKHDTP